ncbi:MAG: hypothetical protein L0Z62_26965 [Gemmataceae bacterium]|nr:hypothetical protein [Gemmataceae bacterium]
MTEAHSSSLAPFAWIYKRDGRLVPFEADKISRALFAATESLGRPDAFLTRELTDSILHFLATDGGAAAPTTADIAELVIKVVRELGQPALAQAYEDFARRRQRGEEPSKPASLAVALAGEPSLAAEVAAWVAEVSPPVDLTWRAGEAALRDYSLRRVFTRDLVAAQADGLLSLTGLETPLELAGGLLPFAPAGQNPGILEAVEAARSWAGGFVAVDGPEYSLANVAPADQAAADFARDLNQGMRLTHLHVVVNLNSQLPPRWADDLAEGPLFAGRRPARAREPLSALTESLLERLLLGDARSRGLRVDWHLGERDFRPEAAPRLIPLCRQALSGAELAFVFDRPRRPVSVAEGMDRQHPGVLLAVGLHLPRLAELAEVRSNPDRLLQKLGSLVRLAISAALQKREFLRRHSQRRPAMTRGFLLERARLVLTPVGIEETVRQVVGEGFRPDGPALDLARRLLQQLQECLRRDGPVCQLESCLDSSHPPRPDGRVDCWGGTLPWEYLRPPKNQIRIASPLQAVAELGTVVVLVPQEYPPTAEEAAQLLGAVWQQTAVVRIRFLRVAAPQRQLTAPWAQETTRVRDDEGSRGRPLSKP